MAPSILGKRARVSIDGTESNIVTRARRRIQILDESDKPDGLLDVISTSNSAQNGRCGLLEELAHESPCKSFRQRIPTTPAKHGRPGRRLPVSPALPHIPEKPTNPQSRGNLDRKSLPTTTPRTPRRRDALRKEPITPITPKHRVSVIGKLLTPQSTRKSSTKTITSSIYNEARKLFTRGANPGRLVGRDNERTEIRNFLAEHLESVNGGSAYISGPPGTGKSALVSEICDSLQEPNLLRKLYVNCMSVNNATDIYSTLAADLEIPENMAGLDTYEARLKSAFSAPLKTNTIYLLVMDEIDQLLTVDLNVLYNLFDWSMQPKSRLILMGIANALDFTERFLPRLKARNLSPNLIPFLPYTAAEISSVLTARSRLLLNGGTATKSDFVPILHPAAIQLISRKVASQSGDLRKAFDIARRVVDLVESETKESLSQESANRQLQSPSPSKRPLAENPNLSSPYSMLVESPTQKTENCTSFNSILSSLTAESAPRATLAHVIRITAVSFGNGTSQRLKSLNLQQKAILCSLAALERKLQAPQNDRSSNDPFTTPTRRNGTAPTIRALFNAYTAACKMDNSLHPLTNSEFRDILGSLESLTLVTTVDGKNGSFVVPITPSRSGRKKNAFGSAATGDDRRVAGVASHKELEVTLEGAGSGILKGIFYADVSQ